MNERTQKLKDSLVIKTTGVVRAGYEKVQSGYGGQYRPNVKIDVERARLLTQAYKESEDDPIVLKRAKGLKKILENMSLYIREGELLAGGITGDPASVPFYPEVYWRWFSKEINGDLRGMVPNDETLEEINEIVDYWKGKAVHGQERKLVPEKVAPYQRWNGAMFSTYDWDCLLPDYDWLMEAGLEGIKKKAREELEKLDEAIVEIGPENYVERRDFLRAGLISADAVIAWANRYSALAKERAAAEGDPVRKKELEKIAEMCAWVPENPPRTFYEALQSFLLAHLVVSFIEQPLVGLGMRLDQVMYPFYKADIEAGRITKEEAIELLESLWVKFMEVGFVQPAIWSGAGGAGLAWQNITVGGVTPDGRDAVNDLSYLILEATGNMRMHQPPVEFRYSTKTPESFLDAGIELAKVGMAQPAFFNDDVIIPMLLKHGVSLEDARNYGINNCMHWQIPGKALFYRATTFYLCLPKMLELALSQGVDKFTGKKIGASTPDPLTFTNINDIMESYLEQVRFFTERGQILHDAGEWCIEKLLPRPFASSLFKGCVEKGEDCVKYHEYYRAPVMVLGPNNVADSLAAIKKFVFEEKKVPMEELLDALKNNWENKEDLRRLMLTAPKFGNDDDYVDLIARDIHYKTAQMVSKTKDRYGNPIEIDGTVASAFYGFATLTGATPDGRKDKEPFHDGTLSPVQGKDVNGPTAALRSASKIDPLLSCNHLLNQKFMSQFLEGEFRPIFKSYLRTWFDMGIHHIQFNTQKAEDLLDAQVHPEKHKDLIVRVCGYAAYFIDLSKGLQNEVISRTCQGFDMPAMSA